MAIKPLTGELITSAVLLGHELFQETYYRAHGFTFDPRRTAHFLAKCASRAEYGAWVAFRLGEAAGLLILSQVETFFGPNAFAQEHALYVARAHRGTPVAERLLAEGEHWARERGCVEMRIAPTTVSRGRTQRFLERLGFTQTGLLMSKEV